MSRVRASPAPFAQLGKSPANGLPESSTQRFMPKMKSTAIKRQLEPATAAPRRFDVPEAKKPAPVIEAEPTRAPSPEPTSSRVTLEEASAALVQLQASFPAPPSPSPPVREPTPPPIQQAPIPVIPVIRLPSPITDTVTEPPVSLPEKRKPEFEYQLRSMVRQRQSSAMEEDEEDEDDEDEEDNMEGGFVESNAVVQLMVDADGNIVVNTETLKRRRTAPAVDNREVIEEPEREYRNVFDVRRREVKWSKQDVQDLWEYLAMTGLNYPFLSQWFGFEVDPHDSKRRIPRRTPAQVKTKVTSLSRKQAIKYDRVVFGDLRKPLDFELFKRVSGRHDL